MGSSLAHKLTPAFAQDYLGEVHANVNAGGLTLNQVLKWFTCLPGNPPDNYRQAHTHRLSSRDESNGIASAPQQLYSSCVRAVIIGAF